MAWLDNEYLWRVPITIPAGTVGSSLTDFPVLLDLQYAPTGLQEEVQATGRDLRFTESDGTTEVPFEVLPTSFGTITVPPGNLKVRYVWVKVPTVSTSATTFYCYYGNICSELYARDATYGTENVWSAFQLVSHDGRTVSTPRDLGLATTGTPTVGSAYYGQATQYDGTSDKGFCNFSIADASSSGSLHVSMLVNYTNHASFSHFFGGQASNNAWQMGVKLGGSTSAFDGLHLRLDNGTNHGVGTNSDLSGTWVHYAGQYDAGTTTLAMYLDGALEDSTSVSGGMADPGENIEVGWRDFGGQTYWGGIMQELRVYDGARSSDWIEAEHDTLTSASAFVSWGAPAYAPDPNPCDVTPPEGSAPRGAFTTRTRVAADPLPPKYFTPPRRSAQPQKKYVVQDFFDQVTRLYDQAGGRVVYAERGLDKRYAPPRATGDVDFDRQMQHAYDTLNRLVPCSEARKQDRDIRRVQFSASRRLQEATDAQNVEAAFRALNSFAPCGEKMGSSAGFGFPRFNHLFYNPDNAVHKRDLSLGDGVGGDTQLFDPASEGSTFQVGEAIAFTQRHQLCYFEVTSGLEGIWQVTPDGSSYEAVVSLGSSGDAFVGGIAVDDIEDVLFWTWTLEVGLSGQQHFIIRTDAAFTGEDELVYFAFNDGDSNSAQEKLDSIAVSPKEQYAYWVEAGFDDGRSNNFARCMRSGPGYDFDSVTLLEEVADRTRGWVSVDFANEYVYWILKTEAAPTNQFRVHRSAYDGSNFTDLGWGFTNSTTGPGNTAVDPLGGNWYHGRGSVGGPNIIRYPTPLTPSSTGTIWYDAGPVGTFEGCAVGFIE